MAPPRLGGGVAPRPREELEFPEAVPGDEFGHSRTVQGGVDDHRARGHEEEARALLPSGEDGLAIGQGEEFGSLGEIVDLIPRKGGKEASRGEKDGRPKVGAPMVLLMLSQRAIVARFWGLFGAKNSGEYPSALPGDLFGEA